MNAEEYGTHVWRAGEIVLAGTYLRVDNASFRAVVLEWDGRLPASYDGHVALYCRAPLACSLKPQPGAGGLFNPETGEQGKPISCQSVRPLSLSGNTRSGGSGRR
jgi:hypothetical protein